MKELKDICIRPVRFSEIDMMTCVWHGSYVTYLEDGRESFGRHYPGIGYADIRDSGIYAPVYDLHITYHAPLRLNDVVEIHTTYVPKIGARLDFSYQIFRVSDKLLCAEAHTTQLFISPDGELMTDEPAYYQQWKKNFCLAEEE